MMDGTNSIDILKEYYIDKWFYTKNDGRVYFFQPFAIKDNSLISLSLTPRKDEWVLQRDHIISMEEFINLQRLTEKEQQDFNKNVVPQLAKFFLEN